MFTSERNGRDTVVKNVLFRYEDFERVKHICNELLSDAHEITSLKTRRLVSKILYIEKINYAKQK